MLIRVLSRGLFLRRESQVDLTARPLGDRKINVEDIKVIHSLPDNVAAMVSSDDGSHKVGAVYLGRDDLAHPCFTGIRDVATETCPSHCKFHAFSLFGSCSERRGSAPKVSTSRTILSFPERFQTHSTIRLKLSTVR